LIKQFCSQQVQRILLNGFVPVVPTPSSSYQEHLHPTIDLVSPPRDHEHAAETFRQKMGSLVRKNKEFVFPGNSFSANYGKSTAENYPKVCCVYLLVQN